MENRNPTTAVTNLLKAEQATQLAICIAALYYQPIQLSWYWWPILFLLPDVSMVGYFINTRVGAICYNIAHHKAVAGLCIAFGFYLHVPVLLLTGLILYAHSSFDRVLGYGLKYPDSFQHTHLGMIGKK